MCVCVCALRLDRDKQSENLKTFKAMILRDKIVDDKLMYIPKVETLEIARTQSFSGQELEKESRELWLPI